MPPVQCAVSLAPAAFTVLPPARARHVLVVPPMQHETDPPAPSAPVDPKFTRALDFKLRRLKEKEILQANLRRPTRSKPVTNEAMEDARSPSRRQRRAPDPATRPRFVTTVPCGQFLLPPPELASLLGLPALYPAPKVVYEYSSRPKAVASRPKRSLPDRSRAPEPPPEPTAGAGAAFRGVRALVAGVVGMRNLVESHDDIGSMATTNYSNMMHDKRVVRGSTVNSHPHAAGDGVESAAARAARTRRRALARRAAAARLRPGTPPPAPGRRHHPIQTEYYLEELFEKGVEAEVGVQTDLFVDRPASPCYVPAKTGADCATQIYPGDLFDFDLEVQPVLEVLVGKTTSQALCEAAQEEELCTLRQQQRRYRELRDADLAERQRLMYQHVRLQGEKERRVAQARLAAAAGREARERAAACALVQGYVAELLPAVLAGLRDQRHLNTRAAAGVEDEFMPWLTEEVTKEIESLITSREVIIEIVRDVMEARAELYRACGEREADRAPDSEPPSRSAGEELLGEEE